MSLFMSTNECVSYKREYVHEKLVNCLFKHAQEKVWLGELTVRPAMTIAVDLGRKTIKQINKTNEFTRRLINPNLHL